MKRKRVAPRIAHRYLHALESLEPRHLLSTSLNVAPNGKTATYTDADGDLVKVAITAGSLTNSNFTMGPAGVADQLRILNLTSSAFAGTNVIISVTRAATGDGIVSVGYINAGGVDIGNVTIAGDLGRIDAGDAT